MNRRELFALGSVACVACCAGPILGALGAVAALGPWCSRRSARHGSWRSASE